MEAGVVLDKDFDGEKHFSCFVEKLKNSSVSRIFGMWNRKFLFLNIHHLTMYYSSGPSADPQTEIRMKNIEKVSIMGNNLDDRMVQIATKDRNYVFKFENLNEFRDFLIYFVFLRKSSNNQQLFEPPESFLNLIRHSQKISESNRALIKSQQPAPPIEAGEQPPDQEPAATKKKKADEQNTDDEIDMPKKAKVKKPESKKEDTEAEKEAEREARLEEEKRAKREKKKAEELRILQEIERLKQEEAEEAARLHGVRTKEAEPADVKKGQPANSQPVVRVPKKLPTQKIDAPLVMKLPSAQHPKPDTMALEVHSKRDSSEEIIVAKKRSPLPDPVVENVQASPNPGKPKKLGKLPQPQVNFTGGVQPPLKLSNLIQTKPKDESDSSISFEEDRKPKLKIESNKDLDWAVTGPSTTKKSELVLGRPGLTANIKKKAVQDDDWDA